MALLLSFGFHFHDRIDNLVTYELVFWSNDVTDRVEKVGRKGERKREIGKIAYRFQLPSTDSFFAFYLPSLRIVMTCNIRAFFARHFFNT